MPLRQAGWVGIQPLDVYGSTPLGYPPPQVEPGREWVARMESLTCSQFPRYGPADLAHVIWAAAARAPVHRPPSAWVESALEAVMGQLHNLSSLELTTVVGGVYDWVVGVGDG